MTTKIGIIYSPGFGAGWSTWGEPEQALDQELALALEDGDWSKVVEVASKNWPDAYQGGLKDCEVRWADKGTRFNIEEYDGSESLIIADEYDPWMTA